MADKDGNALPATAQICPVNNIFNSLFKSVTVKINDVEIAATSCDQYAHIAYLAELTTMSLGAKVRLGVTSNDRCSHISLSELSLAGARHVQ